ncbi:aspartate aminotransferase family protein [Ancylobacter dichloromethanicus]|uniref:Aspartate aminotransferase family protein n=1 Tax=Ancylobacter dichloromethanicus TaxID=518825 RepID=A0A9W6MY95_9HYPH|nr:aspartate aminotransferase family protein [Ancylobacter dichloromethanicus]MBS7554314.1 aspartate aminotransferase family protein [Ancylobacter dichloromethanicus]GLK71439.1 aspartate aminotransferase family protein [Ancylobacter dichloromethanicus]
MLDTPAPASNELDSWDRDHFFHPSTHMAQHARGETPNRIITGAEGVYIVDREGRRSLDAFGGLYCVNVGYGRKKITDAIAEQASKLAYYHAYAGHGSEPSIRLARMVVERAPAGMSRVFFGLSGSDANETNIKLVWYINNVLGRPQKKKIISRWRGYHGSGVMTGSLTGLAGFHNLFDLPRAPILHTEAPYYFRREDRSMSEEQFSQHCADRLEEMILAEGADTIAAFIGEPVLGTGGIVPPPAGYWPKIQAVLKKYDIMLIADEVVTGFGRLGSMFGSDHYGIEPDLITIAKGLTSAYAPLSGVIVSEKVWRLLEQGSDEFGPIGHGWTYSSHPLCTAAGIANLELVDELDLVANAREVGAYFNTALKDALSGHRFVGEVRGEGLLAAVELVRDKDDRTFFEAAEKVGPRIAAAMLERGVIARAMPQGDIIGFAPPLCLTRAEADIVVDATRGAVEAVAASL